MCIPCRYIHVVLEATAVRVTVLKQLLLLWSNVRDRHPNTQLPTRRPSMKITDFMKELFCLSGEPHTVISRYFGFRIYLCRLDRIAPKRHVRHITNSHAIGKQWVERALHCCLSQGEPLGLLSDCGNASSHNFGLSGLLWLESVWGAEQRIAERLNACSRERERRSGANSISTVRVVSRRFEYNI